MTTQEAPIGYTNGTSFRWNTRGQVVAAAVVLPLLGLISVALRFWSRHHKKIGFGLDDAFVLPALLCVVGLGVTLLVGVAEGVIAHTTPPNPNAGDPDAQLYQLTPPQVMIDKIELAFFLLMIAAYGFVKLSILFFYRRIFVKATAPRFDIVSKVAIGITALWTIGFFLSQLFGCGRHIDLQWGPLVDLSRCLGFFRYNDALFISDLVTDLVVICLPVPIIFRLQMTMQRKLATTGILLLGTISIVASIIRIVLNTQGQAAGLALPTDVDQASTTLLYWGMLEAGISLIATNLPSIYFLITKQSLRSFAASIGHQVSLHSLRSHGSGEKPSSSLKRQWTGSMESRVRTAEEGDAPPFAAPLSDKPRPKMEPREPKGVYFAGGITYREGMD